MSLAIFAAYSRVGNIIFISGLVFISLLALISRQSRKKTGMVLVVALLAFLVVNSIRNIEDATNNNEGYTLNTESVGWTQRFAQWRSGLNQYADYPVTGSGLGTFKVLYPAYRSSGDVHTAGNYVHNDYIQFLAEGGPLLLLFALSLIAFLAWLLWGLVFGYLKKRQPSQLEPIVLIVAIGSVMVHALMNFTLYNLGNQILLGCCLARLLFVIDFVDQKALEVNFAKLFQVIVVVVTLYIVTANSLDFISSDLVYKDGILPFNDEQSGESRDRQDLLLRINQIRPNVSSNKFAMAAIYRGMIEGGEIENTDAKRSLSIVTALEYQRGLEINPFQFEVRELFVSFLIRHPDLMELEEIYQTPENLLREGVTLAPCYIRSYLSLVTLLENSGRKDEAYALMVERALPWSLLRYDNYRPYRQALFRKILRSAQVRGDDEVLRKLLSVIGK